MPCSSASESRPKRARSAVGSDLYPKECNFCKKYRVKRKQRHYLPITITTEQTANTLKQAAEAHEDQSLFYEIKDVDLIAKEFKYHESCYKEFTRKNKKVPEIVEEEDDTSRYSISGGVKAVFNCIEEKILKENQAVSMKVLHDIFGLETEDTRYRSKLKTRIETAFPNKLYFLKVANNIPEIVINAGAIDNHITFNDRNHIIQQAALYLRKDIIEFASSRPELTWPISVEDVSSDERKPPEAIQELLSCLLTNKDHPNWETVNRLIQSHAADLVHGVTCGKFITSKHFLLGLGLHNVTG